MRSTIQLLIFFLLACTANSCKKTNEVRVDPNSTPGANIISSVSGRVTDENGLPVKGALITAGTRSGVTDVNGEFNIRDASLYDKAAVIKIAHNGYFTTWKTFFARANQQQYVTVQLIPRVNAGIVNAATGGTIALQNGASVSFPANAVVIKSSGVAYSGNINVAMTWLNPVAANLEAIMPGNLRGVDANGVTQSLTSYGMIGVELNADNGEALQIAAGKTATLVFPLPSPVQGSATATIPMWSFNENNGLWKYEGMASRMGNTYQATVTHFSFWNMDLPYASVQFSASFKDQDGKALKAQAIKIVRMTNSWITSATGNTDSAGYVYGFIPANENLQIQVTTTTGCGTTLFTRNIGPYTPGTVVNLGAITVNTAALKSFTVSGVAKDCNGNNVTNGYFELKDGSSTSRTAITNGNFSIDFKTCTANPQVSYSIVDLQNNQQKPITALVLNAANTVLNNVAACGLSTNEFIECTVAGNKVQWLPPGDVTEGSLSIFSNQVTDIYGSESNGWNKMIHLHFNGIGTGQFPLTGMALFAPGYKDSLTLINPIMVNVVEYGPSGTGYISGSFSGVMQGANPAALRNVQCTFRVRHK